MNRLILFRHAKTERRAPSGLDMDRRLTERGRRDAALMAEAALAAGLRPDAALVSPAERAIETWTLVEPSFPDCRRVGAHALYAADADEAFELATARPEAAVMLVGHNPTLHLLALSLCERAGDAAAVSRLADGFPTAAIAAFDLRGRPRLIAFLTPRDHGGGGDD